MEAEIAALKEQSGGGESGDDGELRKELQEIRAQFEDEKLKSMALQQALQRFAAKSQS